MFIYSCSHNVKIMDLKKINEVEHEYTNTLPPPGAYRFFTMYQISKKVFAQGNLS